MSIRTAVHQFTGNFKAVASLVPHLNKVVKSKSEDEIFEALIDKDKFDEFMSEVYNKLPAHVKLKVTKEQLLPLLENTKNELLKTKKFKKKLEAYKK